MNRRIAVRAALLVAVAVALLVGLTAYFSSEKLPPCLVSGAPEWKQPADKQLHRFLVVAPDRALCFYAIDDGNALVGAIKLDGIKGISAIAARGSGIAIRYGGGRGALVDLEDGRVVRGVAPPRAPGLAVRVGRDDAEYSTRPRRFGFHVDSPGVSRWFGFEGFTWNPRFGPDPPNHGLSLAPGRAELWVVDAPNSALHLFDVSDPARPRALRDLRLSKPLSGKEIPCAHPRCERLGSLLHSADGRYVYVGDAGDVFDASKRERLVNLEALHQSRLMLEVDWADGRPRFPR